MIIRFFRKDYILQYVALLLLQLILWLPVFFYPDLNYKNNISFTSPAYNFVIWVVGNNPRFLATLAFVLVYFTALVLNQASSNHSLVTKNSMVTAFTFILLMSHRPAFLSLSPTLFASLFIVITLYQMFTLYMEKEAYSKIFNIGILLSIGSLFYFKVFLFLGFLWWVYNIYRIYFWREWIIPILGFITVYLFLGVYYFWTEQLNFALQQYQSAFQGLFSSPINFTKDYFSIFTNAALLSLALLALAVLVLHLNEYIISVRKHYWASIVLLLVSLFIIFITGKSSSTNFVLLQIPLSIIISGFLIRLKKGFWADVYLWFLITLIIIHNYYVILSPVIFN